jgi:hypothetical protein
MREQEGQGVQVSRPLTNIARAVSAALRALSICTPTALAAAAALAQSQQSGVLTVDIPAQPLGEAGLR